MEEKYYKDLNHNYLILSCEEQENKYQYKMLEVKKMYHLIPCKIRSMNGDSFLYYEINSKQNLRNYLGKRMLSREDLYNLLYQLKQASQIVQSYLLDANCILLSPEYIFSDIENGNFYFIYYPYYQQDKKKCLEELMELLLDKVDTTDKEFVDLVYEIYEYVITDDFVLNDILQLFEKAEKKNSSVKDQDIYYPENVTYNISENDPFEKSYEEHQSYAKQEYAKEKKKKALKAGIAGFIFLELVLLYVRVQYVLTVEESITLYAGMATSGLIIISLIIYMLLSGKEKVTEEEPVHIMEKSYEQEQESYNQIPVANNVESTETVFIESTMQMMENKLFSTGRGKKHHIDLNRLPCTVGKMKGYVDEVLEDNTISRMHAKFEKKNDTIVMTDLNSTNGTYLNGLRLNPNETVEIECGDEIRLGKLSFVYR